MSVRVSRDERVLVAAGSFTGLWAVTWLGSSLLSAGAVAQGGFAVGGVMAGSGLTALWWKTRTLGRYQAEGGEEVWVGGAEEGDEVRLSRSQKD